jgi:ribonuclease HI
LNPEEIKINIDGASKGNPGKSGIGIVIYSSDGKEIKKYNQYIGIATNNAAEYTALIYALEEALMLRAEKVAVFSDSELLVKQISGEYMVKDEGLKRLRKQFEHLRGGFSEVRIEHIGRERNKIADLLANQAIEDAA